MTGEKKDPFEWLECLISEARAAGEPEPTAMTLANIDVQGYVDARVVLFKGFLNGGLAFFTNLESPKSRGLKKDPRVTLNFYWTKLFKQVRVKGIAVRLSRKEDEDYFATRPRLSQLGAWASRQSEVISSYQELLRQVDEWDRKFPTQVPCPPFWGGWSVQPFYWEFWIGREGRLHERYVFEKVGNLWQKKLLSP